jgi:flagellin
MSVINTNLNALVSQESSRASNLKLSTSMERLSTGKRINSAKDDAAGLSISNRMTSQVRGIQMAMKNSNDAISMSQTAEGAYGQVGNILQRMRELAVQSSSGTMSGKDRAALQLEVTQLTGEIDHIASTTNFNNIKLLDGTAQDVTIQTGANQDDKIKMKFDSVKTNHIGSDIQPSVTSYGGDVDDLTALVDGDLVLNGVTVGSTFEKDDNLSSDSKDASAIAKVAAINRVSGQSGVIAKVAGNTVAGSVMTAGSSSGTITINGYATSNITTTTDASLSRKLVVDAINAISKATGVTATDTESDYNGVVLTAADGRNINVEFSGVSDTTTGVKAAGTYVGSYHLYSTTGKPFTIDTIENGNKNADAGNIEAAGLEIGTYGGGKAQTMTMAREVTAAGTAPTSGNTTGLLKGDTLKINGIAIGAAIATDDSASIETTASSRAGSAIAIAAAINKQTSRTGVTATANANVVRGSGFTAASGMSTIYLNGQSITTSTKRVEDVINAINEYTGQTGVTATKYGDGVELKAADGRNILISSDTAAATIGLTGVSIGTGTSAGVAQAYYSSVSLSSDLAFTVESGSAGNSNFETLGFRNGTFGGAKGDKIAEVDISTQQGASDALRAIDAAIEQVSAAQANSGAMNNRLDVIVNNLGEGLQNMSASRSRILDTDYATETTDLAKQQIISQAATAMLAQANQQSQSVLALLK